jgi:hypothetical protein
VSDSLSDRGQDTAARLVEQGADYAQQLSDYLRRSNSDQILQDVASFARQKPWAVAAGGLVLGFAASRVLRASASNLADGSGTSGSRTAMPSTSTTWSGTSSSASGYGSGDTTAMSAVGTTSPTTGMPAPMTSAAPDPLTGDDGLSSTTSRTGSSSGGW